MALVSVLTILPYSTMDTFTDAPRLTPISSGLADIDPNEFEDPILSDDASTILSSAPNTLLTPSFGSGSRSTNMDSSASDTHATTGSTIFKRKKIKRTSYVFNTANGVEYTSREGRPRWRCAHCSKPCLLATYCNANLFAGAFSRTAQIFAISGTKHMIHHLRDAHTVDKDGAMDTEQAANQLIDMVFRKATKRIEFNLDILKQLWLCWIIVNHRAFQQVEDWAFRTLLCYLPACVTLDSLVPSIISSQWLTY